MKTYVLNRDVSSKSANLWAGQKVSLEWDEDEPTKTLLTCRNVSIRVKTHKLPDLLEGLEGAGAGWDDLETVQGFRGSKCQSVLGYEVPYDGWDQEGSPSWYLAMGFT